MIKRGNKIKSQEQKGNLIVTAYENGKIKRKIGILPKEKKGKKNEPKARKDEPTRSE